MQGLQLEEFVTKKPGLHGGQVFFSPDAGRSTAPSMVSLQILGSIHLYMSWVWDTTNQVWIHERSYCSLCDTHITGPDHLYLGKPNSYARWLWLEGLRQWKWPLCSPLLNLHKLCLHMSFFLHYLSLRVTGSVGVEIVAVCTCWPWFAAPRTSLWKNRNQGRETAGGDERKHTAHIKIQW